MRGLTKTDRLVDKRLSFKSTETKKRRLTFLYNSNTLFTLNNYDRTKTSEAINVSA